MSRMLSLSFHAWNWARQAAKDGRFAVAYTNVQRALLDDSLPRHEQMLAYRLLGSLHLNAGRYAKARRAFRAAIQRQPNDAQNYYLLGLAHENDSYGSLDKAAKRLREAVQLDENNATFWAALARVSIRVGRRKLAKRAILRAAKLAPTDVEVLTVLKDTLLEAGWSMTLWRIATQARFLAGRNAAVVAFWNEVRFDLARLGQSRFAGGPTSPKVLPYVRIIATDGQSHIVHRAM
jgi:tetratricopeptide (TPR) repeat protein